MQNIITGFARIIACIALTLALSAQAQDKKAEKADPAGTWTWTTQGRDGTERTSTLKLKNEGGKLTGKISGRQNNETDISDVKVEGENISFKVTREFNGNSMTQQFKGKLAGDTIKGKIEFERNGETQSRDWEAKRKKD